MLALITDLLRIRMLQSEDHDLEPLPTDKFLTFSSGSLVRSTGAPLTSGSLSPIRALGRQRCCRYPASCLRTQSLERCTRDFAADRLIPSVSAMSEFARPSTSCITSAVR